MFDVICVTDRHLCSEDFLDRMDKIIRCRPGAIILREKDMPEAEYEKLAEEILKLCRRESALCILHSFPQTAIKLGADGLHMPMDGLRRMTDMQRAAFRVLGASCHSAEEAEEAEALGCSYVTFGHIFETDCKAGLKPRGIGMLKEVCGRVKIPVLAIGGISSENIMDVRKAGASGGCVMSGFMICAEPEELMRGLRRAADED